MYHSCRDLVQGVTLTMTSVMLQLKQVPIPSPDLPFHYCATLGCATIIIIQLI